MSTLFGTPLTREEMNAKGIQIIGPITPCPRTGAYYEGYLRGLLDEVRQLRAGLEAMPRDADVDYEHTDGEIEALRFVEGVLVRGMKGMAST